MGAVVWDLDWIIRPHPPAMQNRASRGDADGCCLPAVRCAKRAFSPRVSLKLRLFDHSWRNPYALYRDLQAPAWRRARFVITKDRQERRRTCNNAQTTQLVWRRAGPPAGGLDRRSVPHGPVRRLLRAVIHFFSYHLVLARQSTRATRVAGFHLNVRPTVFHPRYFISSERFAAFIDGLDLTG